MHKSKFIPRQQASVELPKCPKCGEEMWLVRIQPIEPGYDSCTFECPTCDNRATKACLRRLNANSHDRIACSNQ